MNVWGTNQIDYIEVFKNGNFIYREGYSEDSAHFKWEDKHYKRGDNYYIRVSQVDYEIAWINPMHFA